MYKRQGNERVITGLKRVSKPGLRQYAKVNEIPKVLNGLGIVVLSTSQGLDVYKRQIYSKRLTDE